MVSKVGIILQRKCKFTMPKVRCWRRGMVEPLEEVSPWEETLVETAHNFWVARLQRCTDLAAVVYQSQSDLERPRDRPYPGEDCGPGELVGCVWVGRELGNSSSESTSANRSSNLTSFFGSSTAGAPPTSAMVMSTSSSSDWVSGLTCSLSPAATSSSAICTSVSSPGTGGLESGDTE